MKRTIFAFAAVAASLLATQPAFADAIAVRYKDLDLTTASGKKELNRRVDSAARKVCGYDERIVGSRMIPREARECYQGARKQLEKSLAQLIEKSAAGG